MVFEEIHATSSGDTAEETNSKSENENDVLVVFPCLPPIRHSTPDATARLNNVRLFLPVVIFVWLCILCSSALYIMSIFCSPDSSHCIPSAKYIFEWIIYIISFPWICVFTWTVPDCSKPENRKWFLFSFAMSIGWIAAISYVMVEIVEKIGCLLNVDNYTMGLVVIAIGTSVPDAISSILVAKAGHGDMAVSNAIGSNVFDINLGLGLPFLLSSLITGKPVNLLSSLKECLLDVLPLSLKMVPHVKFGLILLLILLICLVVFVMVRFRLNKAVGYLFVSIYIVFMVYAFIQQKSCYGFFC